MGWKRLEETKRTGLEDKSSPTPTPSSSPFRRDWTNRQTTQDVLEVGTKKGKIGTSAEREMTREEATECLGSGVG